MVMYGYQKMPRRRNKNSTIMEYPPSIKSPYRSIFIPGVRVIGVALIKPRLGGQVPDPISFSNAFHFPFFQSLSAYAAIVLDLKAPFDLDWKLFHSFWHRLTPHGSIQLSAFGAY